MYNLPILLVMAVAQSLHLFLVARSNGFCPLESRASTSAPWSNSNSVKRSLLSTAAACNALYNNVAIIIIIIINNCINCQLSTVNGKMFSAAVPHTWNRLSRHCFYRNTVILSPGYLKHLSYSNFSSHCFLTILCFFQIVSLY